VGWLPGWLVAFGDCQPTTLASLSKHFQSVAFNLVPFGSDSFGAPFVAPRSRPGGVAEMFRVTTRRVSRYSMLSRTPLNMSTHVASFNFRPVAGGDGSKPEDAYFSVHPERVQLNAALSARKKADGYWDVWFDVNTINDSPIVARLSHREAQISDAAALFAQVVALPTANRYIIHDVVDTGASLETACTLLAALETLLRTSAPRTRSSERIEEADRDRNRKLKGTCFQAARTAEEERRVLAAFAKLAGLGYRAFEVGPREFAISRQLPGGGTSFQGKQASIEQLEAEAQRADRNKSGWRSWL
jgi:hypothetical protein